MIFPHALFVGTCIIIKLLFPSFITYLARDTLLYFGLSVVYPWICTVALLHQYRHSSSDKKKPAMDKEDAKNLKEKRRAINARYNTQSSSSSKNASYSSPTSSSVPKKHDYLRRRTGSRSSDARKEMNKSSDSVSSKVEMYSKFGDKKKKQPKKKQSAVQLFLSAQLRAGDGNDDNIKAEARYWLRYWIIYGIVTGVGRMIYLLPIVGRIISKSTLLTALLVELKLLWIFWIYGLEWALANTSTNESDRKRSYKVRPLPFLTKKLIPPIVRCYQGISMQILTEETWNTTICTKAASFLELAVMMRLLSDSTTKQILHVIKYAHPFLIPGLTLMMPGFITEYGVIYVKSIVPSAKTFDYKLKKKAGSNSLAALPLSDTMHFLQYWVLQALLSAFLSWWSGILWWIPFSSHIIFCMWCRLQYSSDAWYRSLEMELSAFGLVPPLSSEDDDAKPLQIEDTMTLKILSRVIQALPSATSKATALLSSSNDEPDSAVTKTPPPAVAFEHAKTSPISFDLKKYETDEDDDTLDGEKGEKEEEAPKKNNTSLSPKEKTRITRVDSRTSNGHEDYENGSSNNDDFDAPINDSQETNSDEDDAEDDESEQSQSKTASSLRRSQRLRKNQQ